MIDEILKIKAAIRLVADTMHSQNKTICEVHSDLLLIVNYCDKVVDKEIDEQNKIIGTQRVLPE